MAEHGKRATYADLEAVPEHLVAEIIDGVVRTHPRPSPRHSGAANAVSAKLTDPFQWGGGGPGGFLPRCALARRKQALALTLGWNGKIVADTFPVSTHWPVLRNAFASKCQRLPEGHP